MLILTWWAGFCSRNSILDVGRSSYEKGRFLDFTPSFGRNVRPGMTVFFFLFSFCLHNILHSTHESIFWWYWMFGLLNRRLFWGHSPKTETLTSSYCIAITTYSNTGRVRTNHAWRKKLVIYLMLSDVNRMLWRKKLIPIHAVIKETDVFNIQHALALRSYPTPYSVPVVISYYHNGKVNVLQNILLKK